MNQIKTRRRLIVSAISILSLFTLVGNSRQAFAATTTSDISISMVADRDKVKFGQSVTYTITMTNLGPDDATFVDVGTSLPDQLDFVSLTCDRGISPDTPFCEYSFLESGGSVVSTLVATPKPGDGHGKEIITTTAYLSIENPAELVDPNSSNNVASVAIRLKPPHSQ